MSKNNFWLSKKAQVRAQVDFLHYRRLLLKITFRYTQSQNTLRDRAILCCTFVTNITSSRTPNIRAQLAVSKPPGITTVITQTDIGTDHGPVPSTLIFTTHLPNHLLSYFLIQVDTFQVISSSGVCAHSLPHLPPALLCPICHSDCILLP